MTTQNYPLDGNDEDRGVLRYAGLMGHAFVGVTGDVGQRRTACECNTLAEAKRLIPDDPTLLVYARGRRGKWFCCFNRLLPGERGAP
jgi:hypothetical protein